MYFRKWRRNTGVNPGGDAETNGEGAGGFGANRFGTNKSGSFGNRGGEMNGDDSNVRGGGFGAKPGDSCVIISVL